MTNSILLRFVILLLYFLEICLLSYSHALRNKLESPSVCPPNRQEQEQSSLMPVCCPVLAPFSTQVVLPLTFPGSPRISALKKLALKTELTNERLPELQMLKTHFAIDRTW
jgi:hypothetical protein